MNVVVLGVQATMVDPTIAADGHTYERSAIQDWLTHSHMSPVTGQPLSHTRLVSNQAAKLAIASQLSRLQCSDDMSEGCFNHEDFMLCLGIPCFLVSIMSYFDGRRQ